MFRRYSPYLWYSVLIAIYLILSMTLPVSQRILGNMHVNLSQYHIFMFFVLVPYCLIWLAAFYAYIQMKAYAKLLGSAPEASAFTHIGKGLGVIAWGLAVVAIISTILGGLAVNHTKLTGTVIVIENYIALLVQLFAFTIIGNGSSRLSKLTKNKLGPLTIRLFALTFITFSVLYTWFTFQEYKLDNNPYYLPLPMIILTLIIPYLYAWFLGLFASLQMAGYAQRVKGLLYKRALNLVAIGIVTVIISSTLIQYLMIIFASRDDLSALSVTLVIYVFLVLEAAGFVSISVGAKRLKRIEEI